VHIVPITYRSTNYYIVDNGRHRLLVDAGWPGTFGEFKHALQVKGFKLPDIDYIIITHYHPDHAGLAQDIKNAGAKLIIMGEQLAHIPRLKTHIKQGSLFTDITTENNIVIPVSNSRSFFQTLGFNGEIVQTPSHSDDSISLVFDSGEAFIGDLAPAFITGENDDPAQKDWDVLRSMRVKRVFPGHVAPFNL